MAQFTGGRKVRCTDCTKLSGKSCSVKQVKVSLKKRRLCDLYEFKGEYANRTPVDAMYVPHVDKKTRKLMKKLMDLGVVPVQDGVPMPSSTATAGVLGVQAQQDNLIWKPEDVKESLIWTPGDDDDSKPDSDGGG